MYNKFVVFKNNPLIAKNVEIQDFVVIGKNGSQKAVRQTQIGENTRILTGATIYNGCLIGNNCMIADYASIRENCVIGDYTVIGRKVCIEMNTQIGSHVLIETQSHITGNMIIEDYVYFGGMVITTNDRIMCHPPKFRRNLTEADKHFQGATIKKGARIGSGAVLLPKITIGEEAVIGAGAVVTKDVPAFTVVVGNPARKLKDVCKNQTLTQNI